MTNLHHIVCGLIALHLVSTAPSEKSRLQNTAKMEQTDSKTLVKSLDSIHEGTSQDSTTGQRQKRWYSDYFGFPPINPVLYSAPSPFSRQDPFEQLLRRVKDVSPFVRQPNESLLPPQVPILFPVIFVPSGNCGCGSGNRRPPPKPDTSLNGSVPGLPNRFPQMDDTNQNWGFVVNESEGSGEDFNRPVSFEPIPPEGPINRPPPPVEHGSSQASASTPAQRPMMPPSTPYPPNSPRPNAPEDPTPCERAVLSCCHQSVVTYDCFVSQGCSDTAALGNNPCDVRVILNVLTRVQRIYQQKTG